MDVAGKVALVTGGGTGLGRAIALALARDGAVVAVNYSASEADARQTVEQIRASGGRAEAVRADVSEWPDVSRMIEQVTTSLGPIDILVNNAGVTRRIPYPNLAGVKLEDWHRILDVNLLGAFACARFVVDGMISRERGKIINVASNSALGARGSSIPYTVSKAALVALTTCLAQTLAPHVQVNAVAPGWMKTRWLERYGPRASADVPHQPPAVSVNDVALAVMSIVSIDAMTGTVVVVDGGELVSAS